MQLLLDLLEDLPYGRVVDVCVGLHWTAVVVEAGGATRCGLASTLFRGHAPGEHGRQPSVPQAGGLALLSGLELARLALLDEPTQASLGMAAINALLPDEPQAWMEANAEDVLAHRGAGKRVVMVGHFPFAERLRLQVGELLILEQSPGPGDLAAESAPEVIPSAQVVAITAMTLANHTLEGLLALCPQDAFVMLLGPSAPLSRRLFDYGVDLISGAAVTQIEPVLRAIREGGNFRQVHRAGVRLVNLERAP